MPLGVTVYVYGAPSSEPIRFGDVVQRRVVRDARVVDDVPVADAERPDVAGVDGAGQRQVDARVERPGRGRRVGRRRRRRRVEHPARDGERVEVERAVAGAVDLDVRRRGRDRAAVPDERVEERVPVGRVVDVLRLARVVSVGPAVVRVLVLLHRRRREDEPGGQVVRDGDLEVVVDADRQARGEEPAADLDVVLARGADRGLEEVVEPGRAAAGADARVRVAGTLRDDVARVVEQRELAQPEDRVARVVAVIHVERDRDRAARDHVGRDVELVEVRVPAPGVVDGDVRGPRRVEDVRIGVLAPRAGVEILRRAERRVERAPVHLGGAEVAVEARRRRPARALGQELPHEAVAEDDERARLDQIGRAGRLEHEHARRVVVRDLDVERRELRRLAVLAGDVRVGDGALGRRPGVQREHPAVARLDRAGSARR